jgi:hypothetical protein
MQQALYAVVNEIAARGQATDPGLVGLAALLVWLLKQQPATAA